MKNIIFILVNSLILTSNFCHAQDVTFSFENAQNTNSGGVDYYEVDVMVSTTAPFKMGSGQLYFNYNTAAFGVNIFANNTVETTYPNTDYILGQKDNWLGVVFIYGDFVENDNLDSRYSFSWQQSKEGDCISTNVTGVPTKLLHLKITYADVSQSPDICFESTALFTDQTFTHCGDNDGNCGSADEDCINEQGTQITNDNFDCSGASLLPLELLAFYATPVSDSHVLLEWETANEFNTSHFEIERSIDGFQWQRVGSSLAAGYSVEQLKYDFHDRDIATIDALSKEFYYRLRMVDMDESFEYSPVRFVRFISDTYYAVFPNPTSWGINISNELLNEDEWSTLKIYSISGQRVLKAQLTDTDNSIKFPVSMQSGVYQIVIVDRNGRELFVDRVVLTR